jgi:hypothetical protein
MKYCLRAGVAQWESEGLIIPRPWVRFPPPAPILSRLSGTYLVVFRAHGPLDTMATLGAACDVNPLKLCDPARTYGRGSHESRGGRRESRSFAEGEPTENETRRLASASASIHSSARSAGLFQSPRPDARAIFVSAGIFEAASTVLSRGSARSHKMRAWVASFGYSSADC